MIFVKKNVSRLSDQIQKFYLFIGFVFILLRNKVKLYWFFFKYIIEIVYVMRVLNYFRLEWHHTERKLAAPKVSRLVTLELLPTYPGYSPSKWYWLILLYLCVYNKLLNYCEIVPCIIIYLYLYKSRNYVTNYTKMLYIKIIL